MKRIIKIIIGFTLLLAVLVIFAPSCINMFKGPEDFQKNHFAGLMQRGIDGSIQDEVHERPPSGYLTKGYSRDVWDLYWNRRINTFSDFGKNIREGSAREHYQGPTGEEFIQYIIEKRRERGLPEINIEERNKPIIEELTDKQLIQVEPIK